MHRDPQIVTDQIALQSADLPCSAFCRVLILLQVYLQTTDIHRPTQQKKRKQKEIRSTQMWFFVD